MIITSSEPKCSLGISGKGVIKSLGIKAKARPKRHKKSRYAIENVSMKDLSKTIRGFETLPYKCYGRRRPKENPTDSYFYLSRQVAKCMMRDDEINLHVYSIRSEMTSKKQITILHVCSADKS